jgi:protoheme ferro-lyase
MTVDDWVFEAIEERGKTGATLRQIQRYIDEHHYEELAVDTIEAALEKLVVEGKLSKEGKVWHSVHRTTKDDALKKLFGES